MSVFSVPVTIGVDEERIAKEIECNVENRVVDKITEDVKKVMFERRSYYDDRCDDPAPIRRMVREEIVKILEDNKDVIIEAAAKELAEKLSRTKAVKEVAVEVAKKAGK